MLAEFIRDDIACENFQVQPQDSPDRLPAPYNSFVEKLIQAYKAARNRLRPASTSLNAELSEEIRNIALSAFREKLVVTRIFAPGNFFTHAGYIGDLDTILNDGNLMSPAARVNTSDRSVALENSRFAGARAQPDSNALFFHHLGRRPVIGYSSIERGDSDIVFVVPAQSLASRAKAIKVGIDSRNLSTDEIAVTASASSEKEGELTGAFDDTLAIPLTECYVLARDKERVYDIFRRRGYSEAWISTHIIAWDSQSPLHYTLLLEKQSPSDDRWPRVRRLSRTNQMSYMYKITYTE